jgi:hypothetical protein
MQEQYRFKEDLPQGNYLHDWSPDVWSGFNLNQRVKPSGNVSAMHSLVKWFLF